MNCPKCGNEMLRENINHLVELDGNFLTIKNVPVFRCKACGDTLFEKSVICDIEQHICDYMLKSKLSFLDGLFKMDDEKINKIENYAKLHKINTSEFINKLVDEALERDKKNNEKEKTEIS